MASPTDANAEKWAGVTQKGVVIKVRNADGTVSERTIWIDPGFGSSPLAGHPFDQLLLRKGVAALGDERAFGLVRDAVLSPTRLRAWDAFVDGAFSSGIVNQDGLGAIQGQTSTAGIVPFNVARALLDRGARLSPVVFVDDRLLVGKKALRHARAGDELSQEQWRQLPTDSTMATWYWDVEESRIMAVYSADESRSVQLAIAETGEMRSAYLAKDSEIEQKIRSGRWIALK